MPTTVDWRHVSLLGIDVGFSAKNKSTGIAIYDRRKLVTLTCIGSSPQDRTAALPAGMTFDAIAIDGPMVAAADAPPTARHCERILSRGKFSTRCKPGLSHFGFGLPLRLAATTIAEEMTHRRRIINAPIVEAFPNAFLGVLLDDDDYAAMGHIRRGRKSDVFYARLVGLKRFDAIFDLLGWHDDALRTTIDRLADDRSRAAHEHRAALVCLLTAACALSDNAEYVGDETGGWICLPPKELWADWAREALPP